ncbi:cytochrome c oxidase subunit IVB [Virgibacillus oceani]|uniref:Cytochrome c oxidase subunit 4B n=1 Tax=Virgibacillus oceani TaxID=1479511 RepID=A0A917M0R1_9BACI|nr:cytochrome c oxidase subunit IVB [Virgibacillus oceani]GGG70004.1 cytochrome c oxidase subunit 4B [Virgibacillus oceani]
MTENTGSNKIDSFHKKKNKEEMQKQLISFALMIVFTILAFVVVATGMMDKMLVIPILLILAIVQVAFQFYYFMHMKHEGHEMASAMIYGGIWAAILAVAGLSTIVWW